MTAPAPIQNQPDEFRYASAKETATTATIQTASGMGPPECSLGASTPYGMIRRSGGKPGTDHGFQRRNPMVHGSGNGSEDPRIRKPWSVPGFPPERRIMPYCLEAPRKHSGGPMPLAVWIAAVVAVSFSLAYLNSPGWIWIAAGAVALLAGLGGGALPMDAFLVLAGIFAFFGVVLGVAPLRRLLVSRALLAWYRGQLPAMSQTEQEAIDAGTVWWDGDLFSGRPDWKKLLAVPRPKLTAEEQSFLDNETEQLCAMVNDWETTQVYQDLPPHAWQFIKDKGFLGMIIPKKYGGKEFSATLHSQVIQKLGTRCSAATVHVMVPNSLGPAELLLHYGTDEQKSHYLPRLAKGLEIPCFGLTNPHAGSDAVAIPDFA